MKHAGSDALDTLEPLLERIRALGVLRERKRGSFAATLKVSLHFHEDPTGLYADLRVLSDTVRMRVSDEHEQQALVDAIVAGIDQARAQRDAEREAAKAAKAAARAQ